LSAAQGNFWALGEFGVVVFFVISGFLITGLLLDEIERAGRVDLGRFYLRRTVRIFPPYYAFLICLAIAAATGAVALVSGDVFSAMTYTANYKLDRSWFVGHTWSLSVEEQFYLLWPALLLVTGVRRGLWVAAAVVVVAPVLRLVLGFWPALRPGIGETFPSVADALATGCVLAGLHPGLARSAQWRTFLDGRRFWLAPLAVVICARNPWTKLDWLLGQTVMNLGIAVVIERALHAPGDRLGRMLNARPLIFVGVLSYSLYLWQQLFLNRRGSSIVQSFPLNLLLVALAALASYHAIEQPFLRLRLRVERRLRVWRGARRTVR
jgi:peptidoglycan/LPS O-acetylase OafA/YrhL